MNWRATSKELSQILSGSTGARRKSSGASGSPCLKPSRSLAHVIPLNTNRPKSLPAPTGYVFMSIAWAPMSEFICTRTAALLSLQAVGSALQTG